MSNKPETIEYCKETIETLLELHPHALHGTRTQIVWERGYLTGLLARLMKEDSLLRMDIERKVESLRSDHK